MTVVDIEPPRFAEMAKPWPGLEAFTEALSRYFFGRDSEAEDLFRRVRHDLSTLLFGQSGLGKTSLLQAGLFPRLRREGFLPILIPLVHTGSLEAQVKSAIAGECVKYLAKATPIEADENLWQWLHRTDRRLLGRDGREVVPILVFDQFEEMFTIGLARNDRRPESQAFLTVLADLIENRPPEAMARAIEGDPAILDRYLFDRRDYRIVIALREDFLAPIETLRTRAPSLGRNRYRLRAMAGHQGIEAILKPAPELVSPEVADEIIGFVGRANPEDPFGGGIGGAGIEVEPSLLSLVCHELNERRLAQGLDRISNELLAGSRDEIITDFYERALKDEAPALRNFVEDQLLDETDHRDLYSLDRAYRLLSAQGVPAAALDRLVQRRLLRTEERLGLQRVEIIHDVLAPAIRKSREARHLREAKANAAAQETALRLEHRRVLNLRLLSGALAVLLIVMLGVFFWGDYQRKQAKAERLHAEAEQQRAEANFERASTIANSLVTMATEKMRNRTGIPAAAIKEVLDLAERDFQSLAGGAPESAASQERRAVMLFSFAEIYLALGDSSRALDNAKTAEGIMLRLTEEDPENVARRFILAETQRRIGEVLCLEPACTDGDRKAALAAYREAEIIMEAITADHSYDPAWEKWQEEVWLERNLIGNAQTSDGNFANAGDEHKANLAFAEKMAAQYPQNSQWRRNIATSEDNYASALKAQSKVDDALELRRKGIELLGALVEDYHDNTNFRRDLAVSYMHLGDSSRAKGDIEAARNAYRRSVDITKQLTLLDSGNLLWQRDLALFYSRLSATLLAEPNPNFAEALTAAREDLKISQALTHQDPSNSLWQRDLLFSYLAVGRVLEAQKDLVGALKAYQEELTNAKLLSEKDPKNTRYHVDLVVAYERVGDVLQAQNDLAGALAAYRNEAAAARDPNSKTKQVHLSIPADRIEGIGDKFQARGDFADALTCYQDSLTLRKVLIEAKPDDEYQRFELNSTFHQVIRAELDLARLEQALATTEELVADRRRSYDASHKSDAKQELADALSSLSWVLLVNNRVLDALAAADEAVTLDPSSLSIALRRAHALLVLGRFEEAKAIYLANKHYGAAIRTEFNQLRKFGIDRPERKRIEALLRN
jgi:tetratricopeptide (TPR) repeat protein